MSEPSAEVFVLVRPDLTRFRAELEAELRAIGTKGINIPVTVGGPGTAAQARTVQTQVAGIGAAATQAVHPLEASAAAMRDLGTATGQTVRVSGDYLAVSGQLPPTLRQQAIASEQAARAENDLLLAQKGLTREQAVLTVTSQSSADALKAQAAAAAASARGIGNFSRGIASTGLSLFGLRGATLAATGSFLVGAAAVTAFAKAIGTAVAFDREMSVLQATTGATADEMARAGKEARNLGRDLTLPGVSAQDAAVAITELAKAGLTMQEAIDGARGTLQLATAAAISNEQAVTLAANALNAFELPGKAATQVADSLANAANASQGSIVDMGIALQQSAAVAHLAGISFRDTVVFLTELARAGLTSSDAGTSLRTALTRLINPTTKMSNLLDTLHLRLRDVNGNIRPEFFTELGVALQGMGKAQAQATLAILGGSDAIRAFGILSKATPDDLHSLQAAIDQQGTAADLAAARTKGLAGSAEGLKNNLSDLATSFGHLLIPALKNTVDRMNDLLGATVKVVDVFKSASGPVKSFANSIGLTGAAAAVATNAFRFQVSPVLELVHVIKSLTSSQKEAATTGGLTAESFRQMTGPIDFVKRLTEEGAQAFADAAAAARKLDAVTFNNLQAQLGNLLEQVTLIEIAGGSAAQRLAALGAARAKAEELLAAISGEPGQTNKKVVARRRAAEQAVLDIINQQKSANAEIKAAADKAAADRKAAAAAAQKKLDDADQALLTAIGLRRGSIENQIARAGLSKSLQDDIKFQRALTEELRRERAIVAANIHDETLKAQQIQSLTQAIISSISATRDLVRRQREEKKARDEARKQAIQDKRDRAQESRELDVQIAEAKGNTNQERKAHEALLKFLIQRRRHTSEGTVEWKKLTLAIEQERKSIRDLKAETDKRNEDFKALQFEFLQTQAGFAANLLSNILPTSAVAGTVGGGAISTPTGPTGGGGGALIGFGPRQPDLVGVGAAGGPSGPSSGQMSILIHINRQILAVLMRQIHATQHPEAVVQKAQQAVMMDIF